jgi:predicted kinase
VTERVEQGRIEIPADALVLLVGASGSGKTSLAARLLSTDAVLSSDALRGVVSGDPANQAASGPAFRILHAQAARRLADGRLTVIDATNIAAAARRPLLRLAAAHRRPAIALVLDLPAATCLERNAARAGRVVPEAAVRRQLADLRRALDRGDLDDEGFERVVVLTDSDAVDGTTVGLTKPAATATLSVPPSLRRTRRQDP